MLIIGETYKIKTWEDTDEGGMITAHGGCKIIGAENTLSRC
jgi:hypothetical protein